MAGITQHTQGASLGPGPCPPLESPHPLTERRLLLCPSRRCFGWPWSPWAGITLLELAEEEASGTSGWTQRSPRVLQRPQPDPSSNTKAEPGPSQTPSEQRRVLSDAAGQGHVPSDTLRAGPCPRGPWGRVMSVWSFRRTQSPFPSVSSPSNDLPRVRAEGRRPARSAHAVGHVVPSSVLVLDRLAG